MKYDKFIIIVKNLLIHESCEFFKALDKIKKIIA